MGVVFRSTPTIDETCPWRKKKRMEPLNCRKNHNFALAQPVAHKYGRRPWGGIAAAEIAFATKTKAAAAGLRFVAGALAAGWSVRFRDLQRRPTCCHLGYSRLFCGINNPRYDRAS